ncbi:branched-chain amino acid ABC transporter permease, partial [Candidatus Uhrbacteria bacterium]|nr:branched-chain amino acid ABC transporter permease [Candidatus Uhrbacteria bacterium]
GLLFALITASFSLIYSVTRVLHLAHGAVMIAAGYAFYTGLTLWHWPLWLAIIFAIIIATALGLLINSQIYERMRKNGVVSIAGTLIATISILLIIQNVLLAVFGSATKFFSALQGQVHTFGTVNVTDNEVRIIILCPILLILLTLFLSKTRIGKALRAVADNEMVAEVVGISARRMRMMVFGIGSALAGIAGILFAIEYSLVPSMVVMATLAMFFRTILGGIGSIGGAVLGSLLIETVIALTGWYWNIGWVQLTSFIFTFLVLLIRPHGLLGKIKRSL